MPNVTCKICSKKLKNLNGLSKHIIKHNITSEEYYLKYIGKKEACQHCGGPTKFKNLVRGYQTYCSSKCCNNDENKKKTISEMRECWWATSEKREQTINKIQSTVSSLWKNKSSVYHTDQYRNKLSTGLYRRWNKWRDKEALILFKEYGFEVIDGYSNAHNQTIFKCLKCKREFETVWNYLQSGKNCPYCYPNGISKAETDIYNFIKQYINEKDIIRNTVNIIPPKEIDIFIPRLNIGIEYNGLWTHSENCEWGGKDRTYHINKTLECEKNKIQLIHIFEDEWVFKKDLVKSRLQHILGVQNKPKIYARKCIIKPISTKEKNNFLKKYHLQGQDSSKIKLGAFYNKELVSVMTFSAPSIAKGSRSEDNIWELNRFCSTTDYHVIGIAGKLLEFFKRNYAWIEIFSYADRRWSNGNLYYKLGFNLESITQPNYWYIKNYKRIHRFSLRKPKGMKNITEFQLRLSQGYNWIWDCGNYKFTMLNLEDKKDGN